MTNETQHTPKRVGFETFAEAGTQHTPGPWIASLDMDGRHGHLAILTDHPNFKGCEGPYHPKIAMVSFGKKWGGCSREIAEANARLIAAAPETAKELERVKAELAALKTRYEGA